jgi:hypothetical protein
MHGTSERRERQARSRLLERARDACGSREECLGRLLAQSVQGTPSGFVANFHLRRFTV